MTHIPTAEVVPSERADPLKSGAAVVWIRRYLKRILETRFVWGVNRSDGTQKPGIPIAFGLGKVARVRGP